MKKTLAIIAIAIAFNINAQNNNTAFGYLAYMNNKLSGSNNTAYGAYALYRNTGNYNTASGGFALNSNTTGEHNTASGAFALEKNISGSYNTSYGYKALQYNTTGSNNTAFGYEAKTNSTDAKNQTVIGYNAIGQDDNSVTLGNSEVTAVYMGEDSGATVYAAGLRTASNDVLTLSENDATFENNLTVKGDVVVASDARLKANIVSLGATLAKLLLIDGKTYTMKKGGRQKIGLLAQNIQEVFPELVSEDDNEMLAINYQGLVPVLINALKEQDSKILRLEHLVEKLIADK